MDTDLVFLVGLLIVLIIISAYFSGSETAMMSLNRYRLKHRAEKGDLSAKHTQHLLKKPDQLIGLILLGNNFVNILAAQIAAIISLSFFGENSLFKTTLLLTAIILVFAEVIPKTLAVISPEKIALPSSWVLRFLMFLFYPVILLLNKLANGIIRMLGVGTLSRDSDTLNASEIRTVVEEAGSRISHKHREMLFGILDLEEVTIEDIMIPRSEIYGIDLTDEWVDIVEQLTSSRFSRVPCYSGNIDNIEGVLHMRRIRQSLLARDDFSLDVLKSLISDVYFVPLTTDLYVQLINFQSKRERMAFVVNEYGDIEGLVTLEDLLEEILGDLSMETSLNSQDVFPQDDGTFLVDGAANIREINRIFNFGLPTNGPKTINGLITETMEDIPDVGTTFLINGMKIEIVKTLERTVKIARLSADNSKRRVS